MTINGRVEQLWHILSNENQTPGQALRGIAQAELNELDRVLAFIEGKIGSDTVDALKRGDHRA